MIGFQKYEKLLNKKRKKEAYINLMTNDNQTEIGHNPTTNGFHNEGQSKTDDIQVLKEDYEQVKARITVLRKRNMESPKLYLLPRGVQSLLRQQRPNSNALNIEQLVKLLTRAISGGGSENLIWCCLKRCRFISRIVLVIVEGLGTDELAAISDYTPEEVPSPNPDEEAAKDTVEEAGKLQNGSLGVTEDVSGPPPTKRQKRVDCHGDNKENPETSGQSQLLSHALPLSAPLFALHLNIQAPTQLSCDPIERILSAELKNLCFWRRYTQEYKNLDDAFTDKVLLRPQSKGMMMIENNYPIELKLTVEDHEDNMSRLDLMLSLEEMINHGYPLNMKGNSAFEDPEFSYLHPVVEEVTPTSPMFGIDCEMCQTERGSELTWLSVVDEQLKVVYTKYVRPKYHIVNYLTKYSGITREILGGIRTSLAEVQNDLRSLLPKDAILVGHHFNYDMKALKIFHPYVIDTSLIYNLKGIRTFRAGLKLLSKLFLNKEVQSSKIIGHNPSEDAAATLELALLKLRHDATFGDAVKNPVLPFEDSHHSYTAWRVTQEKQKTQTALSISAEYKLPIFKFVEKAGNDAAVVTTEEGKMKVMPHIECQNENLIVRVVSTPERVLKVGRRDFSEHKFLVCHCPMPEYSSSSKADAKRQLAQLDQQLAKLRKSLPPKALMLTIFTGSPWSVPLDQRSNAAAMLDVVDQERWKYFR